MRTAVLISGRGSNLRALIEAARQADYPAEIALVLSDRAEAAGLEAAAEAGIATAVLPGKQDREAALTKALRQAEIELVCLAGFMRILSAELVEAWRGHMLNIHPSLLPAFPGLDTHKRALEAGVRISGCTVHFVAQAVDEGPIVGQAAVPVLPEDDEESLAARVLAAEHRLYPRCLSLVASGAVHWGKEGVVWKAKAASGELLNPAG